MPLHKIKDFNPNYQSFFDDRDILGYDLYSNDDKIGSVHDLLVDDSGKFRYIVVSTGVWIFGKKVLVPAGRVRVSYDDRRIYVSGLTREQVDQLPEYDENQTLDYDYEERVRGVYRPSTTAAMGTAAVMGTAEGRVDTPATLNTPTPVEADTVNAMATSYTYDRDTYDYDRHDADLYVNPADQSLRLYEERLVADKTRQKSGEVSIGKHVETETAHVAVPVEKERVVIERVSTSAAGTVVSPGEAFREGEVARVEVYEETPEIRKEAFVREEVRVSKEVEQQTVQSEETIRREELDVTTQGHPDVQSPKSI
jgi:uncharacterized protein (TIGR02271 family)